MSTEIVKGIYQHFKGNRYEVIDIAINSETLVPMVIYKSLYQGEYPFGTLWVRPLAMFKEDILVENQKIPRFKHIS